MIEYRWRVSDFKVLSVKDECTCPVTDVYWRLQARDGAAFAEATGITSLDVSALDPQTFKPIAEVNKDDIISWVRDALGETAIEQMKQDLAAKLTPSGG